MLVIFFGELYLKRRMSQGQRITMHMLMDNSKNQKRITTQFAKRLLLIYMKSRNLNFILEDTTF